MIWRVSTMDIGALVASSLANSDRASFASTESRTATTVAERGSSVYMLISPMICPRAISRTMCSRCRP